ncbi:Alpha/beta hydrolase fold [Senna tora]|uniref:Alpha/beta hydrolase fold n=1 Tax=Senna tora TaxID=362788 RepID=A0A834T2U4_9FABA|nr:Alpha/beta hydrolase fold [Senna tora]
MKLKNRTCFKLLCVPLSISTSLIHYLTLSLYNTIPLLIPNFVLRLVGILVRVGIKVLEMFLRLNFRLSNLSPCSVTLDDKTVVNFWVTNKPDLEKPNVALIHGYGGTSWWQFYWQIRPLSRRLNLYVPDLLFFGDSRTGRGDRSDVFQAKCVGEGMRKLGVSRYSVAGISYGGYVSYRMAEMYPKEVDKVVIVSCGICYREEEKEAHLKEIGRSPLDLLVPQNPNDLRGLLHLCMYKFDPIKWVPDFFLEEGLKETLIIWGDKDKVFPIAHAYQLERHLEPKAKVAVIKDTGHAVNYDAPIAMANLIISFCS